MNPFNENTKHIEDYFFNLEKMYPKSYDKTTLRHLQKHELFYSTEPNLKVIGLCTSLQETVIIQKSKKNLL